MRFIILLRLKNIGKRNLTESPNRRIIGPNLRAALRKIGIPEDAIRTQEVGDYWRERGLEFLVSKRFDITLTDFSQIDEILKVIDTKGVNYMRIGELKNKDMQVYRQQGKIEALKAAQKKAEYLVPRAM